MYLMMARYVPLLKAIGARVLFQVASRVEAFLDGWTELTKFLHWISLILMHSIFTFQFLICLIVLRRHSTRYQPRFLICPFCLWMKRRDCRAKNAPPWVSCASGHSLHQNDRQRSLPLSLMAALFEDSRFQFFAINHDMRPDEAQMLSRLPVTDLSQRIHSFADTARFVQQMDLIISCDSAVAHLAGGLGKNVWTLLPLVPDWRWLMDRDDSPWYKTMRLFRQTSRGDWTDVIGRVREALRLHK